MSTRRVFLKQSATIGAAWAAPTSIACALEDVAALKTAAARPSRSPLASRIKSVVRREETILRYDGSGDNWHMTWANDDRQYVSMCDGAGFTDKPKDWHNSRLLSITEGPRDARFQDLPGYPKLAEPAQKKHDPRYYNFGTLALDGCLYQFLSTFNRSFLTDETKPSNELLRFIGTKLIYSPDNGRTWRNQDGSTPVSWESWDRRTRDTMAFFQEDQEAFSLLTVLQMGQNYEHNRDGYVYVYSPNGNSEGTMNELVMFRVPKQKLLDRNSYEFFAARDGAHAKWTKDIEARVVVHTFPRGWVNTVEHPYAWHPSVAYNAPLGLYMMANWGMGCASNGMWFSKPSYLGLWVSATPWGPWTQIHEELAWQPGGDKNSRAYQPQIAPKWIAADGKSFWLVWTDFQVTDQEARTQQTRNYQQNFNNNAYTEAEVVQRATTVRTYRRYYTFNVQRVDLTV